MKRLVEIFGFLIILAAAMAAPAAAQSSVTPTSLANMTYNSEFTDSGTVTLVDGVYDDPSAQIHVELTDYIAMGELNGLPAAAVILATNTGGSGVFVELAVVQEQDGVPVHVASQILGDRVHIDNLAIRDNQIILLLTVQGFNDPFCCPTAPLEEHYQLESDNSTLTQTFVIALAGGPGVVDVSIDAVGLDDPFAVAQVLSTPYDASMPPGPTGAPTHIEASFNEEPRIWIYPVNDYTALWDAAGNSLITQTVLELQNVMAQPVEDLSAPLPLLPPNQAYNDLAAQITALDFANGAGIRFVGRTEQSPNPVCGDRLNYYYQGLSSDNRYYVAVRYPVTTTALPSCAEGVSQDAIDAVTNDRAGYLAQVTDTLNAAAPSDFTPDLATLDAIVQSITISEPAAPTTTPINAPGLTGVVWQWEEQYDENNGLLRVVPNPENYTLLLNEDGTASVQIDCNSGGGTYTVNNTELSIDITFTTMAFCGEESLDQDYLEALSRIQNYAIMNGLLFVSLEGGGSMVFSQ